MTHDTQNENNALIADLMSENANLTAKLEDNEITIDNLTQEVASLTRKLRKAEQQTSLAREAEAYAKKRAEAESKRRAEHGNRIQQLQIEKKNLADELAQVKGELTDALNLLDAKTAECLENADRIDSLHETIRGLEEFANDPAGEPGTYCDICTTRLETITGRDLEENLAYWRNRAIDFEEQNLALRQHKQDIDGLEAIIGQREAVIGDLRTVCAENQITMNKILAAASQHLDAIQKLVQ